ncbi:MAG TPA: hypothetical protein VHF22_07555 [Planctomycetota bacterium]|nr:hypothetical protein [Planctomycetota bacterium]
MIPGFARKLLGDRDALFLLTGATTMFFLALDAWLSHLSSGTITRDEWIPVAFGPPAGLLLLAAGAVALRKRAAAVWIAVPIYLAAIAVGGLGAWLHYSKLVVPNLSWVKTLEGGPFVYVPPILAPLAFALTGALGLSALFEESPQGSGRIRIAGQRHVQMPLAKDRAYLLLVALGIVLAVVSATLDHGHEGLGDPWMWLATAAGVFAAVATFVHGLESAPPPESRIAVLVALGALALTGLLGEGFHLHADIERAGGHLVPEKFIAGAPPMAPLLYAYMATLGAITVLPPALTPAAPADRIPPE